MVAPDCLQPRKWRMSVSHGEVKDAIEEEEATCWGAQSLAMNGGSTTGIGEEPGESNGKTSFHPVFARLSRAKGNLWQSVHTEDDQAVNPNVFHGGVPLFFVHSSFVTRR